jgi:hypothetical protein
MLRANENELDESQVTRARNSTVLQQVAKTISLDNRYVIAQNDLQLMRDATGDPPPATKLTQLIRQSNGRKQ